MFSLFARYGGTTACFSAWIQQGRIQAHEDKSHTEVTLLPYDCIYPHGSVLRGA